MNIINRVIYIAVSTLLLIYAVCTTHQLICNDTDAVSTQDSIRQIIDGLMEDKKIQAPVDAMEISTIVNSAIKIYKVESTDTCVESTEIIFKLIVLGILVGSFATLMWSGYQREKEETSVKLKQSQKDLAEVNAKLEQTKKDLADANAKLEQTEKDLAAANTKLEQTQKEQTKTQADI